MCEVNKILWKVKRVVALGLVLHHMDKWRCNAITAGPTVVKICILLHSFVVSRAHTRIPFYTSLIASATIYSDQPIKYAMLCDHYDFIKVLNSFLIGLVKFYIALHVWQLRKFKITFHTFHLPLNIELHFFIDWSFSLISPPSLSSSFIFLNDCPQDYPTDYTYANKFIKIILFS